MNSVAGQTKVITSIIIFVFLNEFTNSLVCKIGKASFQLAIKLLSGLYFNLG